MPKEIKNTSVLVRIDDLKFITTPSGKIVCVLVLNPSTFVTIGSGEDTMTYEVLRLNDLTEVRKFKVNVGQILDVNFTYTTISDIKMEFVGYRVEMRPAKIPDFCSVCDSKLQVVPYDVICSGHFCDAKSRTMLKYLYIKMFDFAMTDKDLEAFDKYLDNFPTWDGHTKLSNIIDYLRVFKALGTVNVQRRVDLLDALKLPEEIHEFELLLWQRIKEGFFKKYPFEFWDLFTMVKKNRNLFPYLSNLSPDANDLSNQLVALPVDDDTKDDFISNIHHIKALFNELTA